MNLTDKILQGDHGAAAKLISRIENDPDGDIEEIKVLEQSCVAAHIVGITGAPGVGKSTLIGCLIEHYRKEGKKVGVLAVDPSSPFTGGALLGDRVRMQLHSKDDGVFIRSMATRGHLGGLSKATAKAIKVLNGWGGEVVIVETVGVGQSEVEVMKVADTVLVVLAPGQGDDIQMSKAGILEIADIFVINKADQGDSANLKRILESVRPGRIKKDWSVDIVETIATKNSGIKQLYEKIEEHFEHGKKN